MLLQAQINMLNAAVKHSAARLDSILFAACEMNDIDTVNYILHKMFSQLTQTTQQKLEGYKFDIT